MNKSVGISEKDMIVAEKEAGALVRSLRKSRGWSQQKLADEAHVDQAIIGRLELGMQFGQPATIIAIARALEVRPGLIMDALADIKEDPETNPGVLRLARLIAQLSEGMRAKVEPLIEYIANQEHNAAIEAKYDRQLEAEAAANQQDKEAEDQLERISARARERAKAQPRINRKTELENKS